MCFRLQTAFTDLSQHNYTANGLSIMTLIATYNQDLLNTKHKEIQNKLLTHKSLWRF